MSVLKLEGCRNDTLFGYLKALGILRLVTRQCDSRARGSWDGATFVLHTTQGSDQVVEFFQKVYSPTPIVNPWNNGAGFDGTRKNGKQDRATEIIAQIRATNLDRWEPYRRVIEFIFSKFIDTSLRKSMLEAGQKDEFIRGLRALIPEEGLDWIDSAVGITQDDVAYPYLLGSGGNDGRLDFSVNFGERALSLVGERPVTRGRELLLDSLFDSSLATLTSGAAIGQFSARHAGGMNASTGFDADSLLNPWDYVLMLEGSLCFRSAVATRLQYHEGKGRVVFPFAFRDVAGGYGSASVVEKSRGELWLPVWDGLISYPGLRDLFRRGRMDSPYGDASPTIVRSAADASEAAIAAVTKGVDLGLRDFKRVAFLERNGLAFTAATVGNVRVSKHNFPIVASLSRAAARWIEQVRRLKVAESGDVAELLRMFDNTLFALVRGGKTATARGGDLLTVLARLEFAVARRAPDHPAPLPYLESDSIDGLGNETIAKRLAVALSSFGGTEQKMRIRLDLEHVRYDDKKHGLVYDRSREPMLSSSLSDTLSNICVRRYRIMGDSRSDGWITGTRCASIDDVANMLDWRSDSEMRGQLSALLIASSIISPPCKVQTIDGNASGSLLPAAFAVMKIVVDHPTARDSRILHYLRARDFRRALELATRRARQINGLPPGAIFRNVADANISDCRWYASVLLVPIERAKDSYEALLSAALVNRPNSNDVERYLNVTFPEPHNLVRS